jgi:hypothetical protein
MTHGAIIVSALNQNAYPPYGGLNSLLSGRVYAIPGAGCWMIYLEHGEARAISTPLLCLYQPGQCEADVVCQALNILLEKLYRMHSRGQ